MRTTRYTRWLSGLALAATFGAAPAQQFGTRNGYTVYVGTYTNSKAQSKGIYACRFQPGTGKLTLMGLAAETVNPSFLAVHPNQRFLYAANEIDNYQGRPAGSVSAFSIDAATGKLTLLNTVSSRGTDPCYVAVDASGKCLLVANYTSGSTAAFPVKANGSLGEASAFVQHSGKSIAPQQQGPHAHMALISPDNRFVLAPDLGADQVVIYKLDAARAGLTANQPGAAKIAPGSGPRHAAFHPNGRFVYVVNEIKSTVTALAWDAGTLKEIGTVSTLPKDYTGPDDSAEIAVHPNGRFLYASNRGHDSLAVFRIDARLGTLRLIGNTPSGGRTPRNFVIDPTGGWLLAANEDSNNLVVFRIDGQSGRLTPAGQPVDVPSPVSLVFVPAR